MSVPSISSSFAPSPMPPTPPFGPTHVVTQFATGRPGAFTDKQERDIDMREQFGALWRESREKSSQMKAEQREQDKIQTAAYLEQKENPGAPHMSGREHSGFDFDLDLHWSTDPGSADDEANHSAKRSAANAQDDSGWNRLYFQTRSSIYQDQASLQAFYNELNGYACSENACTSGSSAHLEWTGQRPDGAREPFTYPVLIHNALRIFNPKAFRAAAGRLHAVSFSAPYPHMNDHPPFQREAVRVMASGGECEHIKPYQPASCTTFPAGDPVAHIDKFFNDNRAQGKVPGVVFADSAVIEKWARERSMKGETAIAIGPDRESLPILLGLCIGGITFVTAIGCGMFNDAIKRCPRAVASRVKSCWDGGKSAAITLWKKCQRTPPMPPAKPVESSAHAEADVVADVEADVEAEESSVVIDDSDSDSGHLDDFSSSTASSAPADSSENKAA